MSILRIHFGILAIFRENFLELSPPTHPGLQLVSAVSLGRVEDLVPGYFSYGYRGLNKAFHTDGAVLHVFASNPCPHFQSETDEFQQTFQRSFARGSIQLLY